jgi:hypothetical protein
MLSLEASLASLPTRAIDIGLHSESRSFYRYTDPLFDSSRCSFMSYSTYAPTFKVPNGFPELLAELTTEIQRDQPESAAGIYQKAYEFFLRKQQTRDAQGDAGPK